MNSAAGMRVLEVGGLNKRYRDGTWANRDITFDVEPGELLGILGPNGAGKTTLVRQITTELVPTSGDRPGPRARRGVGPGLGQADAGRCAAGGEPLLGPDGVPSPPALRDVAGAVAEGRAGQDGPRHRVVAVAGAQGQAHRGFVGRAEAEGAGGDRGADPPVAHGAGRAHDWASTRSRGGTCGASSGSTGRRARRCS